MIFLLNVVFLVPNGIFHILCFAPALSRVPMRRFAIGRRSPTLNAEKNKTTLRDEVDVRE